MPQYDIQGLNQKYVEEISRRKKLLGVFIQFRSSFFKLLTTFSDDAQSIGLPDFYPLEMRCNKDELVEGKMIFHTFTLLIISTDEVYFHDPESNKYSARIFVYSSEDNESTPFIEIAFYQESENKFSANMQWYSATGAKPITGLRPFNEDQAGSQGEEFAELLIGHVASFDTSWREKPPLGIIRNRNTSQNNLGFRVND